MRRPKLNLETNKKYFWGKLLLVLQLISKLSNLHHESGEENQQSCQNRFLICFWLLTLSDSWENQEQPLDAVLSLTL